MQELPARYGEPLADRFYDYLRPRLVPHVKILDVGSGRSPTLAPELRPPDTEYVGLDISRAELEAATPSAYNKIVVGDIASRDLRLIDTFDLVLSWQVLEHVEDLEMAVSNIKSYLRPGGRLVAQLSGSFALFAVIARMTPHKYRDMALEKLLKMNPDEKFKTHYDRCGEKSLERLLDNWGHHEIVPRYCGAMYFSFFRPLEQLYLVYENWLYRGDRSNLATHYLVVADC